MKSGGNVPLIDKLKSNIYGTRAFMQKFCCPSYNTPPPPQQNKIKSFQELHKNNPEWDKTASQQKKFNKLYRTKRSLKKATFQSQLLAQIH